MREEKEEVKRGGRKAEEKFGALGQFCGDV
jgi:hypothetical protein